MKRPLVASVALGIVAPTALGAAVTWSASPGTGCWDEYNTRGTRHYRVVAPRGADLRDCTLGIGCFWGYAATDGRKNRLYVPHGADPATACAEPTETTGPSTLPGSIGPVTDPIATEIATEIVTERTPTDPATTAPGDRFGQIGVGGALPSDADCAAAVRPMTENRPVNAAANATAGSGSNATYPRVTGDFVGTTDEIIQWTACKWGIGEDWVRAQITVESHWNQAALGGFTADPARCAPGFPVGTYPPQHDGDTRHVGRCPESVGVGQVRWLYHRSAFAADDASRSTAYNLDYTYAVWRECYEGRFGWLNDVAGAGDYAAGDALGCLGVWHSGRWHTVEARRYIEALQQVRADRVWERANFPPAEPVTAGATSIPVSAVSTTNVAPAANGVSFVADFSSDTALEAFDHGAYHADGVPVAAEASPGEPDADCNDRDIRGTIDRASPEVSFHLCEHHLTSSVGDASGHSIASFSPRQTFTADTHTHVSFDVNVTDPGLRQWWEVSLVPVGESVPTGVERVARPATSDAHGPDTIVIGTGPAGFDLDISIGGRSRDPLGHARVCDVDPEACASTTIRRSFAMTDHRDGTITFDVLGSRYTYSGEFPDRFRVSFEAHDDTSDTACRDRCPGSTWHWDNIVVS